MDINLENPPRVPVCPASAPCEPRSSVQPADSHKFRDDLLSFFVASSVPALPPKGWESLPQSDDVRHLHLPAFEIGVRLEQKFGQQQLVEAGIITAEPFVNLSLPIFSDEADTFVVDRDEAGRPRGIWNERGSLFKGLAPAISCGVARAEGESNNATTPLLVAETIEDLQVLRGLGFPTALSVGLQNLNVTHVEELFGPDNSEDHRWRYRLVITNWDVARLRRSARPRAAGILKRLALMQRIYAHDPRRRFAGWRPDVKTRDGIHDAFTFGDAKRVRQLIESSLPLPEPASGTSSPFYTEYERLTYMAARSKIYSLLAQCDEIPPVADIMKALDQFRQLFHREVLAPIYEMANRAKSPLDRAAFVQLAESLEEWFAKQKVVRAAKKVVAGCHPGVGWELDADDFNERLRLNNLLLKLRRDLLSTGR